MTPEQAQAIARRIGMSLDTENPVWYDESDGFKRFIDPESLPTYLSTGDRPLRVAKEYKMIIEPADCIAYVDRDLQQFFTRAPTIELAILACAAAIEGEGYE